MRHVALCTVSLIVIFITHWVYRWRHPKCSGRLPPGSMGLPLLGETLQFFSPNTSTDVPPFIKQRMERYGPLFRTSLVGRPVIVSTNPELNQFIFQQEGRFFQSWYPNTITEIFGRKNVSSLLGFMYKYLKNMVLNLFGPKSLKERLLLQVEEAACKNLRLWSSQPNEELKEATAEARREQPKPFTQPLFRRISTTALDSRIEKLSTSGCLEMIFYLTTNNLISYDPTKSTENLRENFVAFIQGLISFPINIPGTAYHKCLQGQQKATKMLKNMLQERLASLEKQYRDFFDHVVEELRKEKPILTEAIALDLMFVLLFASFEKTSLAITIAIKFLTDHPSVLVKLTEEHETSLRSRDAIHSGITWKEFKSMKFTSLVSQMRNMIPKGWAAMVCPPAVHLNPEIYQDPLAFNPSRWEGVESNGGSKHFKAFGGGMRFCAGTDFTMLQMAIFLHCLVSEYRWTAIRGGNIVRTPGLSFPNGSHIQLFEKLP